MNNAAAFFATYSDWRLIKGRKVVQVVFEVPIEASGIVHDVLGGMPNPASEVWCAIARLKQQPKEAEAQPRPPVTESPSATTGGAQSKKSWHDTSPAQQAGILCNEDSFVRFLIENHKDKFNSTSGPANHYERAAQVVRQLCGVQSRKEIRCNNSPGTVWGNIVADYRAWMKEPEVVG